jgi:hypothetical protein
MQKYLQAICDAARCAPPETADDHLLFFFTLTFFFWFTVGQNWRGTCKQSATPRDALPQRQQRTIYFFFFGSQWGRTGGAHLRRRETLPQRLLSPKPSGTIRAHLPLYVGLFLIHQGSFAPILSSRSPRGCQDPLVNECW